MRGASGLRGLILHVPAPASGEPNEDNSVVENKEVLDIPAPQNVSELKQLFD